MGASLTDAARSHVSPSISTTVAVVGLCAKYGGKMIDKGQSCRSVALGYWVFLVVLGASEHVQAGEYRLVLGQHEGVCQRVLQLYEEGALKDVSPDGSLLEAQDPTDLGLPEFSRLNWGKVRNLRGELSEKDLYGVVVDIDNDRKPDWVIRSQWMLSSQLTDQLAIYKRRSEPLEPSEGFGIEELSRADATFYLTQAYYLKKIPKYRFKDGSGKGYHFIGGSGTSLIPFRFRDTTYILIAGPSLLADMGDHKFLVIAKITPALKLDDVCYIQKRDARSPTQ